MKSSYDLKRHTQSANFRRQNIIAKNRVGAFRRTTFLGDIYPANKSCSSKLLFAVELPPYCGGPEARSGAVKHFATAVVARGRLPFLIFIYLGPTSPQQQGSPRDSHTTTYQIGPALWWRTFNAPNFCQKIPEPLASSCNLLNAEFSPRSSEVSAPSQLRWYWISRFLANDSTPHKCLIQSLSSLSHQFTEGQSASSD